jgi:hypothetical protein
MTITDARPTMVADSNACTMQVPIAEALRIARVELAASEIDIDTIIAAAREYHTKVADFGMPESVSHFYRKSGLNADMSERTFATMSRTLCLFAAWQDHREGVGHLSLPDRFDLVAWHGFLIQTPQYAGFMDLLGRFVHHETLGTGQEAPSLLTIALFEQTFGFIDEQVWADGIADGIPYITYGWCSVCND